MSSLQRLLSGEVIDRHRHHGHQLIYVSAGVLVVQSPQGSWVASRDRAIWIPSETWHEHRAYGASTIHTAGFDVQRPPLESDRPMTIAVDALLRELLFAVGNPALPPTEADRLRAVLRDRLRHAARESMSLPAPHDPRLASACAIALQDLSTSMSLPALARAAGTTPRTLSRLFRREITMSYPRWRAQARSLQAMVLLAEGRSITDTATRCGWKTSSAFIDDFRRIRGQTPGEYRKLNYTD